MATYLFLIYISIVVLVCIAILFYTETPSKALGYLLLVISFPVGGIIIYLSVGLNYRKRELYQKKLIIDELEFPLLEQRIADKSSETLLQYRDQIGHFYQMASLSKSKNLISGNNTVHLLINGEQKFPDLLAALEQAQHHIHIEYYIFENDLIGNQLAQVLMTKARQGIQVRFIYDDYGCRGIRKNIVKQLRDAGVEVFPFYKIHLILLANRLNYRNHRKIIVIDGITGYVGGINVADKYINRPGDALFWRDTHLKITGASVVNLQFVFLTDWNFCANQKIGYSIDYFPFHADGKKYGDHLVQIVSSGPDSKYPKIKYSLIQSILMAKSEVCITTPYFIPDKSFLEAINIATLSGTKIKLLLPGISDSFIVNLTTRSYFESLLEAGVEIYIYNKGFVHAKTMVCDRKVSIIGTANLDNRSFDLNFEINGLVYDNDFATKMREVFENDLKDSKQITLAEWQARPLYLKFFERVLHLFSSLM